MSRSERVPVDVPQRHVDSGLSRNWMAVRVAEEVVIIHEPGEASTTAYTIGGATNNPRVMASASAVMWKGMVLKTVYEDGLLVLQHTFAGIQERLPIDELLEEAVPTLQRTEVVRLKGVGGRVEFECINCGEHIERERHQMDVSGLTPKRCASCTFKKMGRKS